MPTSITRALTELAARQHGVLSLEQVRAQGLSRQALRTAVAQGWLAPFIPGVYRIVGAADSVDQRLMSGLLLLGPAALVSHEAAARLHGFDRAHPEAAEFTVPRTARVRSAHLRVHTTDHLLRVDRVHVQRFPCTSATRTILDLARARVPVRRLEAAIDSAVRSGATSPVVLARRLGQLRGPGRWGVRAIDRLLPDSGGHTPLERRFLRIARDAGLSRPATQVVFRSGTRTVARVDFLFPEANTVVEVTGRLGHVSDAERTHDAQRRNELQAAGLVVLEFTSTEVLQTPEQVATRLFTWLSGANGLPTNPNAPKATMRSAVTGAADSSGRR